jgi:hypothetical protein
MRFQAKRVGENSWRTPTRPLLMFWVIPNRAFFGVFDGHSGQKASNFAAENIGQNIVDAMLGMGDETENILEQAVRAGYLTTDTEFLKQEFGSGGQPNGARAPSPATNPLMATIPKGGGFPPLGAHGVC